MTQDEDHVLIGLALVQQCWRESVSEYLPILTKQQFVREYKKGTFGNASITWDTPADLEKAGYKDGLVHLRSRIIGGPGAYNVGSECALHLWQDQPNPSDFYVSAMAPHSKGTIQGELQLSERGLWLEYNTLQLPMREAFAKQRLTACGIIVNSILQHFMFPSSYDWLQVLLDRYKDHVIEFSCFSIPWGTVPHENVVWWECRRY